MPGMKISAFVLAIVLCVDTTGHTQGTTREERTISAKQRYKCTYDGACYELRFKTPEEGCKHWATHLPGFTYQKTEGVNDAGAVTCICKKGNEVNDQGGMIRGEIVCADELAVPITENRTFLQTTTCECPNKLSPPYYVAFNDKCVLDECDTRNMQQDALLQWATTKLQKIVDEENATFAANTGRINDPNVIGSKPLITDKEYQGWGNKFGTRPTPGGPVKYNDSAFAIAYGHAVERLTAVRVSKDLCLSRVLQYVPNSQQSKSGGQPDFKAKGDLKSGDFDVTTVDQAKKKKQPYIFITYTRLIELDEHGNNVPRKPKNK